MTISPVSKHRKKKKKKNTVGHKRISYVQYVCLGCAQTENIPDSVVKAFDVMDIGDSLVPPRFSCERCGEDMYPQDCWDYVQVIRFSLDEKGPGGFPGFS